MPSALSRAILASPQPWMARSWRSTPCQSPPHECRGSANLRIGRLVRPKAASDRASGAGSGYAYTPKGWFTLARVRSPPCGHPSTLTPTPMVRSRSNKGRSTCTRKHLSQYQIGELPSLQSRPLSAQALQQPTAYPLPTCQLPTASLDLFQKQALVCRAAHGPYQALSALS